MISAVVVSYRSQSLAARALESLRVDAAETGLALETIAVVNSADPEEARALASAADRVVIPGRNLGFAGGLNAGLEVARGEILVLANPDVVVRAGTLAALAAEARGTLVAAGPTLFLDERETLHLPPAEEPHPFELARRRLAGAGAGAVFRRFGRARRAAEGAERRETRPATALSGAFVAVSRRTLERIGTFDEGYALYFEENDWQRRLRRAGGRLARVGEARVVHRYNQSARLEPLAASWFAASERRYFETHFPARGPRALEVLAAAASARAAGTSALAPLANGVLSFGATSAAVALSPVSDFGAFALDLHASGGSWQPPEDVRRGFGGASWYARAVDLDTLEIVAEGVL